MGLTNWNDLIMQLEAETASLRRARMQSIQLKRKVEEELARAESNSAGPEIVNRLDMLLIRLTEASKESICTNTKCPHYNKKCKMR